MKVNNAAVLFNEIDTNSAEHAETVLRTNFYSAKMLTEALLPLFRRSRTTNRILNVSSQLGLLNKLRDPVPRRMLLDEAALTGAGHRVDGVAVPGAGGGRDVAQAGVARGVDRLRRVQAGAERVLPAAGFAPGRAGRERQLLLPRVHPHRHDP